MLLVNDHLAIVDIFRRFYENGACISFCVTMLTLHNEMKKHYKVVESIGTKYKLKSGDLSKNWTKWFVIRALFNQPRPQRI